LQRSVQGTWLGISRQGRIAILTNFREEGQIIEGARSRGEIPLAYLTLNSDSPEPPDQFAQRLLEEEGVNGVGGFSLIFGQLKKPSSGGNIGPLGILSNRTPNADDVVWLFGEQDKAPGHTVALSNSHYGDRGWPKVVRGEELVDIAIQTSVDRQETTEILIERFFEVLSTDTLPTRKAGQDWELYAWELRNSILIPPIGESKIELHKPADEVAAADDDSKLNTSGRAYGTQKQTVVLVDWQGKVIVVERTLFDNDTKAIDLEQRDRRFEFEIEGWHG